VRPPDGQLAAAISRAGRGAKMRIKINYEADGRVTDASIEVGSRDRDLDRAALTWAKKVKLCPGAAGVGILPLDLTLPD
jgi:periplasmic protein TonB